MEPNRYSSRVKLEIYYLAGNSSMEYFDDLQLAYYRMKQFIKDNEGLGWEFLPDFITFANNLDNGQNRDEEGSFICIQCPIIQLVASYDL